MKKIESWLKKHGYSIDKRGDENGYQVLRKYDTEFQRTGTKYEVLYRNVKNWYRAAFAAWSDNVVRRGMIKEDNDKIVRWDLVQDVRDKIWQIYSIGDALKMSELESAEIADFIDDKVNRPYVLMNGHIVNSIESSWEISAFLTMGDEHIEQMIYDEQRAKALYEQLKDYPYIEMVSLTEIVKISYRTYWANND